MLPATMGVIDRIIENTERLTAAERKVAEILAHEPQAIAFGTVAQVASRARTSGPSVVRLAVKLGYSGFVDLQADVQAELARQLGPAHDRIRQRPPSDLLERVQAAELDNVTRTMRGVSSESFTRVVGRLADRRRNVWILVGEVLTPVGSDLVVRLSQLREGVGLVGGSGLGAGRRLAGWSPGDTVVVIDARRYEQIVLTTARWLAERNAAMVVLTDSPLSPLVPLADDAFFFAAQGVGPFDSLTGATALANALVAGVAARLRSSAAPRLDVVEELWLANGAVVETPGGASPLLGDGDGSAEAGAESLTPAEEPVEDWDDESELVHADTSLARAPRWDPDAALDSLEAVEVHPVETRSPPG